MLNIDSDFPGGNMIVEKIDGDDVWLRQDPRDTEGWWFYWLCRITGAAGREVTLHFTDGNVLTERGASISDDGLNWRWLAPETVEGDSFTFRFPEGGGPLRVTYSIPYLEANFKQFLEKHRGRPELKVSELAKSEQGRSVEKLRVRDADVASPRKVLLSARRHACESVANYEIEGVIEFALDRSTGFLDRAELLIIPFVDKDGVEDGDQGKNRRPHDHNRDYTDAPIYAVTRALMAELDTWANERLDISLDLHCPWIRGGRNDTIFFCEPPESHQAEFRRFTGILAETQTAALRYDPANDIGHGVDWNIGTNPTWCRHVREHTAARVVGTLEFPYALASGETVTADRAREFGRSLARAMLLYLDACPKAEDVS